MATSWTEQYCYDSRALARACGIARTVRIKDDERIVVLDPLPLKAKGEDGAERAIGARSWLTNLLAGGVLPYGYTPSGKRRFGIAAPDRHVVRRGARPTSDPTAKAAVALINREHYRLRKKNIAAARARRARAKA